MYRLRFLLLMLKSLFSKPKPLNEVFTLNLFVIPFIDTDVKRMFTHSYSTFMGLARWHCTFNSELKNVALKYKWTPVTVAETIDYRHSIKAFSRVKIETRVLCWNDSRFYLEHLFKINNEIYTQAFVEGLVRSPKGIVRPTEVFQLAGLEKPSPVFPEAINSWIIALEKDNRQ